MSNADTAHRSNVVGAYLMVGAMAAFALEDVFVKAAARSLPVWQVLVLFGMGGAVLFALMARRQRQKLFIADVLSRPMRIRAVFEFIGRLFYTLAIALAPLSAATVILQATPLVVVACAAVIFGETVGWRRWAAILIGLLGVVVIIRPGSESFSLMSILAVLGMLGFAGRDLASRAAPASVGTAALGFYGYLIVAGLVYGIYEGRPMVWPDAVTALYLLGAIVVGVVAYSGLMLAMRTGEVSAVTPFRYTRLLFGLACGVLLFDEQIDAYMLVGCGLIVLSGLFILSRNKVQNARAGGNNPT